MNLPEGFIVVGPDATREECNAAWVANLRNRNVRQARHRLLDERGAMCCMGVVCATVGMKISTYLGLGFGTEVAFIPGDLMSRLGLQTRTGAYGSSGDSLVNNNDSEKKSLSDIADIIESRPPGLFVE